MKHLTKNNIVMKMPSGVYLSLLFMFWVVIFFPEYYNYPFMWDDLHLVRTYSSEELQSTLFGHWDPDKVETPAYRPLATLVYHLQGLIFGENTIYHRVFNLFLLFSVLQILILIAKQFEIPKIQIWVALVIIVFSRIFITLAIWITTSQIITSYILITLSVLFFIRSARSRYALNIMLSIIFYIFALLTREESYIIPLLMTLVIFMSDIFKSKKKYYLVTGVMLILMVVHFYVRHLVIKDYMIDRPFNFSYGGVIYFLSSTWLPGGVIAHSLFDNLLKFTSILILVFVFWQYTRNYNFKKVLFSVSAVVIASLPALITPRFFGTFLPSVIAISFLIHMIFYQNLLNNKIEYYFRVMVISVFLLAGINRSFSVLNSFNPYSDQILSYDSKFIYGVYGKVTIPTQRRYEKELHLSELGIYSEFTNDSLRMGPYSSNHETKNKIIFSKYKITDF